METKPKFKVGRIKDQRGSIIVHKVDLRISSIPNNKIFEGKGAFIIPVVKFKLWVTACQSLEGIEARRYYS